MRGRISWDQQTEWLKAGLAGKGVFLNAKTPAGKVNPMTIGWGQVGAGRRADAVRLEIGT